MRKKDLKTKHRGWNKGHSKSLDKSLAMGLDRQKNMDWVKDNYRYNYRGSDLTGSDKGSEAIGRGHGDWAADHGGPGSCVAGILTIGTSEDTSQMLCGAVDGAMQV